MSAKRQSLRAITVRDTRDSVMQDIEAFLALEVKKEIADRYFGSRKLIEDDSLAYEQQVRLAYHQLEDSVGLDLIRLYILLQAEVHIHDFFRLTGLRDDIFLDPYLLRSQTIRRRVFAGQRIHGLTRRSRFRNLCLDLYTHLLQGAEAYRATIVALAAEQQAITQEIESFQRRNDLGSMMGFLRGLDSAGEGGLGGAISPLGDDRLARKMQIDPPATVNKLLPLIPELPPLKACKSKLLDLVDRAYEQQGQPEILHLIR